MPYDSTLMQLNANSFGISSRLSDGNNSIYKPILYLHNVFHLVTRSVITMDDMQSKSYIYSGFPAIQLQLHVVAGEKDNY